MGMTMLAGILLVKPGRLLIVHPTGFSNVGTWSIPKGHQERREPTLQAAVREVQEETGLQIPMTHLRGVPLRARNPARREVMMYWVVDASNFGLPDVLPVAQLQLEEVDEGRFVDVEEAERLLEPWQRVVLNHVPESERYGRLTAKKVRGPFGAGW